MKKKKSLSSVTGQCVTQESKIENCKLYLTITTMLSGHVLYHQPYKERQANRLTVLGKHKTPTWH